MLTVTDFIEKGANRLSDEQLKPLCSTTLKPVVKKMVQSAGRDADDLLHIIQFIIRIVSEFDEYMGYARTSKTRREAAFALKYFLEEHDIIPDSDKEFGLKDDLIIARTVLQRHEKELHPFADACGFRWDKLVKS
ncbi:MAG: hypothetical protein AAF558_07330 [Verrucomicrobiota bacterium]